ncbi:MAG TPA: shikimate dehydrogenase [Firmicutes bacterium]|nr:shikimate dehydrogenase [Bacillota bacterium]HOQ23228.1 shikimate dehydrogenase [Bacillota bacterium]HPT66657.1 shikimate dehydrogenase [Bacillota bacterium]
MQQTGGVISPATKVYGLFGDPVGHSLSPLLHNTAFQLLGMDCVYLAFRVQAQDLATAVAALRVLGIAGVNVTVPHKHRVAGLLDRLEGDAALTGSVNTIRNNDGELVGYSTDGAGLVASLREEANWEPQGNSAAILGTGGAAVAVAYRLVQEGVKRLVLLGRSEEKAEKLAEEIRAKLGFVPETGGFGDVKAVAKIRGCSLVVNATPLGMTGYAGEQMPPVDPELTDGDALLCDLVYNPLRTRWLEKAEKCGRQILPGLGMLIYQGVEAFRIWTGITPPVQVIREKLLQIMI